MDNAIGIGSFVVAGSVLIYSVVRRNFRKKSTRTIKVTSVTISPIDELYSDVHTQTTKNKTYLYLIKGEAE